LFKNCIIETNSKIIEREASEKIICQKQAYIRYNDEMIKDDERADLEIINRNKNSDKQNKQNFESNGINEKDFIGKTKNENKPEKKQTLEEKIKEWEEASKERNKIQNDSKNIYTKHEISRLRREFIYSCVKIIDNDLMALKKDLNKKCEQIKFLN